MKAARVGFLVWNPQANYPRVVHDTFERAEAEAERLAACNPGERFVVMSPVTGKKKAEVAKAFSEGKAQGYAEARDDVMRAERFSDAACEERDQLRRDQRLLRPFKDRAARFQAIVADCLLWFDGFNAAFAMRKEHERPRVPDRDKLTDLNAAFQRIMPLDAADDEIPF